MSLDFDELFRKKLQEVPHFVKKHEKWSIWPNLYNFSNKLPCLCISMNFSGKSCKKCLISWESSRNHRFRQHYATVRTDYHVFAFRWTFKEKVGKSGSFREKARKIMDLMKTWNFSNKPPCFGVSMNFSAKVCQKRLNSWKSTRNHRFGQNFATFSTTTISLDFDQLFTKKLQKIPHFEKSTKNHRFGQIFITFRTNYHVFGFRWTFHEKVAKTASFREKAREIIDLAKTFQLFEQTTMSLHFDELFRKKLQKVPHFVKKHQKSSIWPKFCNFSNKLPCLCISINFPGKSSDKCLISWKSTKNHRFGQIFITFRTNYHVFGFRWTFQEKVATSASFRQKERKIIDLAKSL